MRLLALFLISICAQAATWYVSTTGNDSNNCTSSGTACLSLNGAYQKASGGDVIKIAAGTYGATQTMAAKTPSSAIYAEPASGVSGTWAIYFSGGLYMNGAKSFELRSDSGTPRCQQNCTIRLSEFQVIGTSQYVTLRNVDITGYLGYTSGNDISVIGGSVGGGTDFKPQIAPSSGWGTQGNRFLFDGVLFHDWVRSSSATHIECLQVAGTNAMTIRNSTFKRCDVFDLSFTAYNSSGNVTNLVLENNVFGNSSNIGGSGTGSGTVHLTATTSATIRFNSAAGFMWAGTEQGSLGALTVVGNNITGGFLSGDTGGCSSYVTYLYNVTSGWDCSASDVNGTQGFTNASTASLDLHLTAGATAINFVPTSVSGGCPATDLDGYSRPVSTACDAGAYEYGAGGGVAPTITSSSPLPDGVVGTAYSQTLVASGDAATWAVTSGALPAGLSLSAGGSITGTPTVGGTSTPTITATNATGSNSKTFSITIGVAPTITSSSPLPSGTVGMAYSQTLTATGDATITWSVTAGALPAGLSLSSGGAITGTPTAAGTSTPTIRALNSSGANSQVMSITIVTAPTGQRSKFKGSGRLRGKIR